MFGVAMYSISSPLIQLTWNSSKTLHTLQSMLASYLPQFLFCDISKDNFFHVSGSTENHHVRASGLLSACGVTLCSHARLDQTLQGKADGAQLDQLADMVAAVQVILHSMLVVHVENSSVFATP